MTPNMSTREELEAVMDGRQPVRGAGGRIYYVRYNEDKEELEEIPGSVWDEEQIAKAREMAKSLRPKKTFGEYFVNNLADIAYGAKKALSGATFGASDWLGRRMGMDMSDDAYLSARDKEGLGTAVRGAGFASELGGNMLGAGGALVKGLGKAGLKGLKLASTAGGLEGAVYGATGSDSLNELPENIALGATLGAALPVGIHGVGKGLKAGLKRALTPTAVKTAAKLENIIATNTSNQQYARDVVNRALQDAERRGKSIIEVAETPIVDVAQGIRQQTPKAGYVLQSTLEAAKERQPHEMRSFIDNTLGSRTRGASIAEVAERAQREAAPIYKRLENLGDLERYEIRSRLDNIAPDKYQPFNPQTGLSAEQYADIVRQQAEKVGLNIAAGNPMLKNSGAMHFVVDEFGKIKNRGPFVGSLADTVNNPGIKVTKGDFVRSVRPINDVTTGKNMFDFVVQKGDELYTKMPTNKNYLAGQLKRPFDNLSVEGDLLSDMGIGPSASGNINISQIGFLVNENSVLKDAISRVKKTHVSLKDLPDTDFRVLDEARKVLSEQAKNWSDLSGYEARAVIKELDPVLDEVIPDYKLARSIYSDAHKFEDAARMGEDVFANTKNLNDFAADVAKLGQHEKAALAVGLRDDLLGRLGLRANEALGFKGIFPQNVQDKMRIALGDAKADAIINEAKQVIRLNQNYNQLLKGSQTDIPVERYFTDIDNVRLADLLTNTNVAELQKGLKAYRSLGSPMNINPVLAAGFSSAAFNNLRNEQLR